MQIYEFIRDLVADLDVEPHEVRVSVTDECVRPDKRAFSFVFDCGVSIHIEGLTPRADAEIDALCDEFLEFAREEGYRIVRTAPRP